MGLAATGNVTRLDAGNERFAQTAFPASLVARRLLVSEPGALFPAHQAGNEFRLRKLRVTLAR